MDRIQVIPWDSDWFMAWFALVVIDSSNHFPIGHSYWTVI